MIKRPMGRNSRAKGVKVKHIVQILLLLGVCIWLIYQVKHSHDKKKKLNDDDEESLPGKMQSDLEFLKLGRKDLNPRVEEVNTSKKHKEEDDDETGGEDEERKHEEDDPQEDNKEEENREQEEAKHEESENEGRGGGDDEIDENDQESEENADFIDDEKEKDDGEGEAETDERGDKEEEEEEISSEENDHDGSDEKNHEAREEHYKGDDASSAVTHDTRLIKAEMEETNLDSNNLEHEEKPSDSEETNAVHDSSRIMEEGTDKMPKDGNSSAFVDLDQTKAEDKSPEDLTLAAQLNEQHPEANDTDQVKTGAGSGSTEDDSSQTQQTEGETIYRSADAQNLTVNIPTDGSTGKDLLPESTYSNSNLMVSLKDENGNGSIEVSSKSSNETESTKPQETGLGSSEVDDGESGVTEEGTDGANGSENAAQEDPIDSSDSGVAHELEETRMDLDTLPEIRTEVDNSDETAAE